jgi:hypothetical protein
MKVSPGDLVAKDCFSTEKAIVPALSCSRNQSYVEKKRFVRIRPSHVLIVALPHRAPNVLQKDREAHVSTLVIGISTWGQLQ